jgi:nucleoside-diphosphate-sugar epimerase
VLIVGCGDVGQRAAALLHHHHRVLALTSSPSRVVALRAQGLRPLQGNLDAPHTLRRLAALAPRVLHLAPPPPQGHTDPRTLRLLQALRLRTPAARSLVYGSTSGVYGNAHGERFNETRRCAPATDRGRRRVHAEACVRALTRQLQPARVGAGVGRPSGQACRGRAVPGTLATAILRIPGIYAFDRVGGDPRERLHKGSPVLHASDDVHTNHIHADDLARACVLALWRASPGRVLHINDDGEALMGEHFDQVADHFGLPRPPRVSRAEAQQRLSPMQMSFLGESRRLDNARMKQELGLVLRHPTVAHALVAFSQEQQSSA